MAESKLAFLSKSTKRTVTDAGPESVRTTVWAALDLSVFLQAREYVDAACIDRIDTL